MIDEGALRKILSQYERFGWKLERVLIADDLRTALDGSFSNLFAGIAIESSDINAAWFTRSARGAAVAWELRSLSESPFALVEVLDASAPDQELEDMSARLEDKLRERTRSPKDGH